MKQNGFTLHVERIGQVYGNPNTPYNVDPNSNHGGSIWKCNTAHTSATADDGLQYNADYWDRNIQIRQLER